MKKCIVISDSFKGSLSSMEICEIARESIPKIFPGCEVVTVPVADGGEGTVECFVEAIQAQPVTVPATGPYGEPIENGHTHSTSSTLKPVLQRFLSTKEEDLTSRLHSSSRTIRLT